MGGSATFHAGHISNKHHNKMKRQSDSCSTGGFYTYPNSGTKLDSLEPVNITWNTECLSGTKTLDVYLLYPGAQDNSRIHMWSDVPYDQGWYELELKPRWWNSTSQADLQLNILPSGTPIFLQTLPAAPIWTATYTAPSTGTPESADTSVTDTDSGTTSATLDKTSGSSSSSIGAGKIAAAVLVPILFVVLCSLAWLKMKRQKEKEKRKRWSQAVDKRMSTISTDWKSMSGAGANAAIRASMAVGEGGNRASSFSFGAIRPQTTYEDGGQAGVGVARQSAYGNVRDSAYAADGEQMSQVRQNVLTGGERQSRVSFALDAHPRPSMSSYGDRSSTYTNNRPSRAFHSAFVPPVPSMPARQDSGDSDEVMSPTQTVGAAPLTAEAISARFSYYNYEGYEDDEAARKAQEGAQEAQRQEGPQEAVVEYPETLFNAAGLTSPTSPTPPAQTYYPASPAPSHSMFSGFAQPASVGEGSPDERIRQYAADKVGLKSPPPIVTAVSPSFVAGSPVGNSRRLTFNAASPGAYNPATGAYGVATQWED